MDDGPSPAILVEPGAAHPYPALDADGLARFVHVSPHAVQRWLQDGLPADARGHVDPFAAANWLSAGRLEECPVMARRWRQYLGWFAPFLAGTDGARSYRCQRVHRLYLPRPVSTLSWFLPHPEDSPWQRIVERRELAAEGLDATVDAHGVVLGGAATSTTLTARGSADVQAIPQVVLPHGSQEHAFFSALMIEVVGAFDYAYRHHRPFEYPQAVTDVAVDARWSGSCIDCAMALGAALHQRGRRWRLCAGIVAHSAIANPHLWLEVETTLGWAPLDPTLPAIVRMLGQGWGDWRAYARAYAGSCDARRLRIAPASGQVAVPGGQTLASAGGEAAVQLVDGRRANAFPCIDWVCGECEATFSER